MASMSGFWNGFAKIAAQIAVWAAEHPQVVQAVVDSAAKGKISA